MNQEQKDRLYRNLALGTGVFTALCFILSLIALIEWPALFKLFALGMIISAFLFLILRSVFKYRDTFKVRDKR